jgi:uncharacterized cupredoxin-like copper-binding protein
MKSNRNPLRRRSYLLAAVASASLLGLAACGDDDKPAAEAADRPATTTEAPTTEAPTTEAPTTDAPPTTETPATEAPALGGVIEVTARDFAFEGLPAELEAGTHKFHFANAGSEPHELLIFKNPEGLSLEEIMELGPEEGPKHVEVATMTFAEPGKSSDAPAVAELTPGEYAVVCFIPTPTDGKAHFQHGMHATFTVR